MTRIAAHLPRNVPRQLLGATGVLTWRGAQLTLGVAILLGVWSRRLSLPAEGEGTPAEGPAIVEGAPDWARVRLGLPGSDHCHQLRVEDESGRLLVTFHRSEIGAICFALGTGTPAWAAGEAGPGGQMAIGARNARISLGLQFRSDGSGMVEVKDVVHDRLLGRLLVSGDGRLVD